MRIVNIRKKKKKSEFIIWLMVDIGMCVSSLNKTVRSFWFVFVCLPFWRQIHVEKPKNSDSSYSDRPKQSEWGIEPFNMINNRNVK